jgi:spore germination protein GerM
VNRHARTALQCAAAVAIVTLGAVGCGIPTDDGPRAISQDSLPDDVAAATTDTAPPQGTVTAPIYLVQSPEDPRLVAVNRHMPLDRPPTGADAATVLETLLRATANATERADGITNLIPQATRLESQPELARGTLVIDLTSAIFDDVEGENQRAAFGQIVCTVDALESVDAVRFQVEGEPTEVQVGAGASDGPLTCARNYPRLLAQRD